MTRLEVVPFPFLSVGDVFRSLLAARTSSPKPDAQSAMRTFAIGGNQDGNPWQANDPLTMIH
jgi:hypothetical protein